MNTRFYSNQQEKQVEKNLKGRRTSNSGATRFSKGDLKTKSFLIECKTCTEKKESMSVKKEWILKNRQEAFAMGKPYSAIAIDFGDVKNQYYIIDENLFRMLQEYIEGEGND